MNRNAWARSLIASGLIGACGGRSDVGSSGRESATVAGAAGSGASMAGRSSGTGGLANVGGSGTGSGTGGANAGGGGTAGKSGTGGTSGTSGGTTIAGAGGATSAGQPNVAGATTAGSGGVAGSSAGAGGAAGEAGSTSTGSACIIRVASTGADSNSGSDWTQAVGTVQRGLDAASELLNDATCSGVEVWVAAGIYRPTVRTDPLDERTATFRLVAQVALYGGFAGGETSLTERNILGNVSTLSGDIGIQGVDTDNSYHVVIGTTGATLDGFTITGGYANGSSPHNLGGGMVNDAVSPLVANCNFSGNQAYGGAGMFNSSSAPVVLNTAFNANYVNFGNGGGMLNQDASPLVMDCTFTGNEVQYAGGAMSNQGSSVPTVSNSVFADNAAGDAGGAMHNETSQAIVMNASFTGNGSYLGGAIDNYASSPVISNTTFARNVGYLGGAMSNSASSPIVRNSTFTRNVANGTARFTGDAFASGGAIYGADGSAPTVSGCTFTGNTADYSGGAIHNAGSTVDVTDTILWGDTAGTSVSEIVDVDTSAASAVRYSIVQGGYPAGTAIIASDPLFLDAAQGELSLTAGSPAIDAGSGCPLPLLDQAGNSRWDIAGVPNVLSGFDIGALEYQGTPDTDSIIGAISCPEGRHVVPRREMRSPRR